MDSPVPNFQVMGLHACTTFLALSGRMNNGVKYGIKDSSDLGLDVEIPMGHGRHVSKRKTSQKEMLEREHQSPVITSLLDLKLKDLRLHSIYNLICC